MNLKTRIAIEQKIVRRVVKDALAAGYNVSVYDGEEWTVKRSGSYTKIRDALFSTDEDTIRLRDKDGNDLGVIRFIYGNDGYDVIADYSVSLEEFMKGANEYGDKLATQYA